MKHVLLVTLVYSILFFTMACSKEPKPQVDMSSIIAAQILGDPTYTAISFGAYREKSRDVQPTIEQLKEDLRLMVRERMNRTGIV
jgi:hypothetical protein